MEGLREGTFDLIVSSDVLEHVDRAILRPFVEKMFRLLRPGALTYHSIDLIDHLSFTIQKCLRSSITDSTAPSGISG